MRLLIALLGMVCLAGSALTTESVAAGQSSSNSHAHDVLIFVTVFNDRGFALFGARVRVRRAEEKKFHWEATSDHRGELAIRVPQNTNYEITIEARGFQTQTRKIDAAQSNRTDLTIHMRP